MLWRDRIDSACVLITQWVEEVMVGKKTVLGSLSGLTTSTKGTMVMNGNGLGNGSLEKQVMALSVSQV